MGLSRCMVDMLQKTLKGTELNAKVHSKIDMGLSYTLRSKAVDKGCPDLGSGLLTYVTKSLNIWLNYISYAELDELTKRRLQQCVYSCTRTDNLRICGHKQCIICQAVLISKLMHAVRNEKFPLYARLISVPVEQTKKYICGSSFLTLRNISYNGTEYIRTLIFLTRKNVRSRDYMELYDQEDLEDFIIRSLKVNPEDMLSSVGKRLIELNKGLRIFDFTGEYKGTKLIGSADETEALKS